MCRYLKGFREKYITFLCPQLLAVKNITAIFEAEFENSGKHV